MHKILFPIDLRMFDGGAASGGSAAGTAGSGAGDSAGKGSAVAGQSDTGETTILYGKQPAAKEAKEGSSSDAGSENREGKFKSLITGEYKDLYDADVNRIIARRFKDTKSLQENLDAQRPILDQLAQRYGTAPGDVKALQDALESDDALWEKAAEEAGMDVGQYRQVQKLQMENQELRAAQDNARAQQQADKQVQDWMQQAEQMKQDPNFADFDLAAEIQSNPEFINMLKVGISVPHAYSVLHLDDITGRVAVGAASRAEKAVTDNIRVRGARPKENGAGNRAGVTVKDDPSKWSDEDYKNVIKAVRRGSKIYL